MKKQSETPSQTLPNGVMLNAYPDSIGKKLADAVDFLKRPELKDAFSLFYILPTFFHSDLDRGFSIIDYDINEELVDPQDLDDLNQLGIHIKLMTKKSCCHSNPREKLHENSCHRPWPDIAA